ncbi:imm11 family protein [Archangium sp.]|uniref:imm11 family protein n=1 Tax=Archangium sp. TaxID=1872627 RepID=UPI002D3C0EE9|nr:DUF1629 domain-containing protein [Archangium sp.]HYO51329.1 DUF1629 domain-containing protein [Archangium sp.]
MSMMNEYFDLWDDMRIPGRWHLGGPVDEQSREVNPWQFKEGRFLELEVTPIFRLDPAGHPLDFTLAGFTIPLVHSRVVPLLERLGLQNEVQFIEAQVEGQSEPYWILNALRIIRCIDDARCEEVRFWEPKHGVPSRVGEYRNVAGLKVDPAKAEGADIFRPWGWTGALIVSERIKLAMESAGITGPRFIKA